MRLMHGDKRLAAEMLKFRTWLGFGVFCILSCHLGKFTDCV